MQLVMTDNSLHMDFPETIRYIDLSKKKIAPCTGCFGCWVKTPGKCVIRDDAVHIYPVIAKSSKVMYISRILYGSYDVRMKTMLERAIPIQQAFIRIYHGETHHVQRENVQKSAVLIAYGASSQKEKEIFKRLVERNAHNMCFQEYKVLFPDREDLEETVREEVRKWESCF